VLEMTGELLPEAHNHISTNPLKMGHNIVLKEIQHLTGMMHCASFSGMEQFGSGIRELGEQSTVSLRRLFLKFSCHKLKI
jgi:hypothetical protein